MFRKVPFVLCFAIALLVAMCIFPVHAQSFTITKTADTDDGICDADCSLREAIQAANLSTDSANFVQIPAGTYLLTLGELVIQNNMNVQGAGVGSTILDGSQNSRVFHIDDAIISEPQVAISNMTIQNGNAGNSGGGAVFNDAPSGTVELNDLDVRDNIARLSGGIYNDGIMFIRDSIIQYNEGTQVFGGVFNGGDMEIVESTILGNHSVEGAGVVNNNTGFMTIIRSTIVDNIATQGGGGILNINYSTLTVETSTISGNKAGDNPVAGGNGGGVLNRANGTITILNSTITNNTAAQGDPENTANPSGYGGGIHDVGDGITVRNTIIAGNIGEFNPDCSSFSGNNVISQGHNLFGQDGAANGCPANGTTDIVLSDSITTVLTPLGNNGGPTPTHTLTTNSPALDNGSCPGVTNDQRGNPRPAGVACDIGAVEGVSAISPPGELNAEDDTYATPYQTLLYRPAQTGVLSNDTGAVSASRLANVTHGSLTFGSDGSFTYVPDLGFTGVDSFTYQASDGADTVTATVTIVVGAPPAADPATCPISGATELEVAPVRPALEWPRASGGEVWYQVILWNSTLNYVSLNTWFQDSPQLCSDQACRLENYDALMPAGLLNGDTQFWLRTYTGIFSEWSQVASFNVALSAPIAPLGFTITGARPTLIIPNNDRTAWINVYVGNTDYTHLQWYEKSSDLCCDDTCILKLNAHPSNGSYQSWFRAWGPGGLSTGGIEGWAGPQTLTLDLPAPGLVQPLTATIGGGLASFTWQGEPGATWYEIWAGTSDYTFTEHHNWHAALDLDCEDAEICLLDLAPGTSQLLPGTSHTWFVRAWGPGGFSEGGEFDGWTQGEILAGT